MTMLSGQDATAHPYVDDTATVVSFFIQKNTIYTQLTGLVANLNGDDVIALSVEQQRDLDKICGTLDQYQEQPHLLDPHLEQLIDPVVTGLRRHIGKTFGGAKRTESAQERDIVVKLHPFFRYIYHLTKVRGYKTVVKFLSHEVSDLEPTLDFVAAAAATDLPDGGGSLWETRYVGMLWMSLICMIPFDLKRIDSAVGTGKAALVERISSLCKPYLSAVSKEYESAAILMMRLLTRRDTVDVHLHSFLDWAINEALTANDTFKLRGILTTLSTIYKFGPRSSLLPTLTKILPCCRLVDNPKVQSNTLLRKLCVKLSQRIGLGFMRVKIAGWRYHRGNRTLASNLAKTAGAAHTVQQGAEVAEGKGEGDEDGEDVPEEVEEIVGILLNGLRDKDTIVRWSSAKGIGRISSRLPRDFAQEVIASVLSLLEEDTFDNAEVETGIDYSQVSDSTWHGSCLALAELARRGLLLPDRLDEVVPWVVRALKFDQRRTTHSVGVHVRDAACYVCWSFARAYSPEVMKPFVEVLARSLVVISCLDREVNVRRAASAAFQENVGRQGVFPHGIEIVTLADYFAVGNRGSSFGEVAVEIARFEDYRQPIFDHVAGVCAVHWDRNIRELAATTLGRLTVGECGYMVGTVLKKLIPQCSSDDLVIRHGCLLAVGEICLAWADVKKKEGSIGDFWTNEEYSDVILPISKILTTLPSTHLDGFGSDQTRVAVCHLITCIASTPWPTSIPTLPTFFPTIWNIVNTSLERREEVVQEGASLAVAALSGWCGVEERIVKGWVEGIKVGNWNRFERRGCALALGKLRVGVLKGFVGEVLEGLCRACVVQEDKLKNDAEARRNAVHALTDVVCAFGSEYKQVVPAPQLSGVLTVLFAGLEDYSTDSRGDVGSWVREACLEGLERIVGLELLGGGRISDGADNLEGDTFRKFVAHLCRQSVEKIDRMRECAGGILERVVWWEGVEDGAVEELRCILPHDTHINWNNPAEVFPKMVKVLELDAYRKEVLVGLVVSVGGLTESLVRHASSSLIDFVSALPESLSTSPAPSLTLPTFFDDLADIFTTRSKQDRVTVPLLEVLNVLIGSGSLGKLVSDGGEEGVRVVKGLYEGVKSEVARSKDVKKVVAGIQVFCGYASLPKVGDGDVEALRKRAIKQVVFYLAHPYPKVRRAAAENLYVVVTTWDVDMDVDEGGGEGLDTMEVEEILLATDWDLPVAELKPVRETVGTLLEAV
ncbi:hypothetical protein HK097_001161 [Rhizophlyctis rosea]|uniref:Tubulin-specific chaperone D n=1 Tax=Rhizophlyctis rosea TaxID=64517 RepID=A0AAD5S6H0_9FUNG|nr:hypothetical protein HK097_001161 [Rhizophlyctis rosea]